MRPDDQWTDYRAATAPAVSSARQGRTWLIVLTAFLVEIVVIAAGCNQKVADNARGFLDDPKHEFDFVGQVVRAGQTYDWRLSGHSGPPHHLVLSQYAMLATFFVVAALLVFALARGAVTFGRAFFGVWLAVIVATELAAIVQFLVVDNNPDHIGKPTFAVFYGPDGYSFFAGVCLGLLTALVAALVAVATRRPAPTAPMLPWETPSGGFAAAPGAYPEPQPERDREQDRFATTQYPVYPPPAPVSTPLQPAAPSSPPPPPWAGSSATRPDQPIARPEPPAGSAAPAAPTSAEQSATGTDKTTRIPVVPPAEDDDPNKTTMLPRTFPRPPDDEDLGHQPE